MSGRVEPYNSEKMATDMELRQFPSVSISDDPHRIQDENMDDLDIGNSRNNFRNVGLPSQQRSIHSSSVRRRSLRPKTRGGSARRDVEVVDIDVSDEEDGEVDPESLKALPAPMRDKRNFRKSVKRAPKQISSLKTFRLRTAMCWSHFKISVTEGVHDLELWKKHMKEVEGRFGNGVLSYFIFLKWLMFLNLFIFIMELCFVTVPNVVMPAPVQQQDVNGTCSYTIPDYTAGQPVADQILDFVTGQGWINTTVMFYSNYAYKSLEKGSVNYKMPLAYLLVGGCYFFCSLFLMIRNLTKSFQESYIEGGGNVYSFCNKVFASWDYCISIDNTAKVKAQNIVKDIKAELAEEERLTKVKGRSRLDRCRLYSIRALVSLVITGILGGAVYAIYLTVDVSSNPKYQKDQNNIVKTIIRSAPSLTITFLNLICPPLFQVLSQFEDWSPRFDVSLNLWRTVILKLASVAVLIVVLYAEVTKRCESNDGKSCCQQSWENQIASQMYMLIWVNFVVLLLNTVVVETLRKLLYKHTTIFKKLGMPEFQISKNVLDLVYCQSLIWIGTFFSPLIPSMGVVTLFILFYCKKVSLMYNNKPSDKPYQGTRSNYLFTVVLLVTFLTCLIAVGWGITQVRPSCTGPFSNSECDSTKRILDELSVEIKMWPLWLQEFISYMSNAAFIFPVLLVICLMLYYFRSTTKAHLRMIEMLKDQLVLEGRDKRFLMERWNKETNKGENQGGDENSEGTAETEVRNSASNLDF